MGNVSRSYFHFSPPLLFFIAVRANFATAHAATAAAISVPETRLYPRTYGEESRLRDVPRTSGDVLTGGAIAVPAVVPGSRKPITIRWRRGRSGRVELVPFCEWER